jgi:tetratricopeptide (TPR) repeat protein
MNVHFTKPRAKDFAERLILLLAVFLLGILSKHAASQVSESLQTRVTTSQVDAAGRVAETDGLILKLQERVKKAPKDFTGYDNLGAAYFQKARESGDIHYYNLAEQTLKKSLELAPADFGSADPLVHISLVYMGEHRFTDALETSQRAIALGSGNLAAFAVEGDAFTDMGDYDEALSAYQTIQKLGGATISPPRLAYMVDSRLAYLRFLHGDTADAIKMMNSAVEAALQTRQPKENLAWLYFELGERYFQAGELASAGLAYSSGFAADTNHYRSLAGLAKVMAAQGNLEESVRLYQRSIEIIPFPVYLAELGDVYRKLGKTKEAEEQYDLVEYIGRLGQLNQVLANRELALFYADRGIKLPEALTLARNELKVRQDIYTWDTLAWVLYKNGRDEEASDASQKALSLNTGDSLLLFHAGMIKRSLAQHSQAKDLLDHALRLNPHFHIFYADLAKRTLNDLSQPASADPRSKNAAR